MKPPPKPPPCLPQKGEGIEKVGNAKAFPIFLSKKFGFLKIICTFVAKLQKTYIFFSIINIINN